MNSEWQCVIYMNVRPLNGKGSDSKDFGTDSNTTKKLESWTQSEFLLLVQIVCPSVPNNLT